MTNLLFPIFIGCAAATEASKLEGVEVKAEERDNSGTQQGGTETSGYGYYIFFK